MSSTGCSSFAAKTYQPQCTHISTRDGHGAVVSTTSLRRFTTTPLSKTPRHPFITPKPWLQETTRVSILELKTSARSRHPILLQSLRCCLPAVCRLPDDDQFLGEDWHICESCNLVPPIHMICRLVDQLLHSGCDEGFPTYIHGAWFLYMCITNLMSFALLRTVSGQWPG